MADNEKLRDWYYSGLNNNTTHFLVVADVVDFTERPVYVSPEKCVLDVISLYQDTPYFIVLDVYSYEQEFELQLLDKKRDKYS